MVSSDRRSGVPTVPKRAMFWARLKLDCAWPIANYMRLTNPNELLGLATHNQICGWGYPDLRSLTNWPHGYNIIYSISLYISHRDKYFLFQNERLFAKPSIYNRKIELNIGNTSENREQS